MGSTNQLLPPSIYHSHFFVRSVPSPVDTICMYHFSRIRILRDILHTTNSTDPGGYERDQLDMALNISILADHRHFPIVMFHCADPS